MPLKPYPRWAGLAAVLLLFALLGAARIAGSAMPLPRRVDRSTVSLSLMMGALLVGTIGILAFSALVVRRNAAIVEAAFAGLGLHGDRYLLRGRQYHGAFAGRQVDAYFVPPARYRSASIELYVGAAVRTRLSVGARSLAGALVVKLAGHPEVALADPSYAHLAARAADVVWARCLLQDHAAKAAILRLASDPPGGEVRFVNLEPDTIVLRISGVSLHALVPGAARRWAEDLASIASAAERLAPPAQALDPSALERAARSRRGVIQAMIVLAVVMIVLLSMAAAVALFVLPLGSRR
jgi:hypothetical protein